MDSIRKKKYFAINFPFFMRQPASPDALRTIILENAQRCGIERGIAESLFETFAILHKPERRELPRAVVAIARSIDHTYLTVTPDNRFADVQNVVRLCREAGEWGTAAVCVRPEQVALAKNLFDRWGINDVAVGTVIDFPQNKGDLAGGATPEKKVQEAIAAQLDGATEFDVVIDYRAILRGDFSAAHAGVAAVAEAVRSRSAGAIVKTILETGWLRERGGECAVTDACNAAIDGGTDIVKTSTGYAAEGGATPEDILLLAELAHPRGVLVKASGGIRTLRDAILFLRLGASRLGMSASTSVLEEALRNVRQSSGETDGWDV